MVEVSYIENPKLSLGVLALNMENFESNIWEWDKKIHEFGAGLAQWYYPKEELFLGVSIPELQDHSILFTKPANFQHLRWWERGVSRS